MKENWLERNMKWIFVGVYIFLIGYSAYWLFTADAVWKVIVLASLIIILVMLTLIISFDDN